MKQLFFLSGLLLVAGCNLTNKDKSNTIANGEEVNANVQVASDTPKGKELLENKCYVCHHPTASEAERIGPPMAAIKARYLMDHQEKDDFIAALWHFVEQPTPEKAKMKGAVRRFGVMPYQTYSQEEVNEIAAFMFDYKLEEPTWFKEHWEERHGAYEQRGKELTENQTKKQSITERGMAYALSTKQELGKNLMSTIQQEGTLAALEFCNVKAYPLTDSMATIHQARIKRVSDKPRNPNNKANVAELGHIEQFKKWVAKGEAYEPIVEEHGEEVRFYYPIITNSKCLQCHGTPNADVQETVFARIRELYPNDRATGYSANEVRGIWSIVYSNQQ